MPSSRKFFAVVLTVLTITSIVFLSYASYLYYSGYKLLRVFDVSIEGIDVFLNFNTSRAIINVTLILQNPCEFSIRVTHIWIIRLRLNSSYIITQDHNVMRYGTILLGAFENATTSVRGNVPLHSALISPQGAWNARISITLRDVPVHGSEEVKLDASWVG